MLDAWLQRRLPLGAHLTCPVLLSGRPPGCRAPAHLVHLCHALPAPRQVSRFTNVALKLLEQLHKEESICVRVTPPILC